MKDPTLTIDTNLKLRPYNIVARAVEEGVKYGVNRAYKHTSTPTRDTLEDCVSTAVMNSLDEVFDYEF